MGGGHGPRWVCESANCESVLTEKASFTSACWASTACRACRTSSSDDFPLPFSPTTKQRAPRLEREVREAAVVVDVDAA